MFKDLPEGQTHFVGDGCGEPAHNDMPTSQQESWADRFDKFMVEEYGKWKIGRAEAKTFISKTIEEEVAKRDEEFKERIEKLLRLFHEYADDDIHEMIKNGLISIITHQLPMSLEEYENRRKNNLSKSKS